MTDLDLQHPKFGGRWEGSFGERSIVKRRMWKIRQSMAIHLEVQFPTHFARAARGVVIKRGPGQMLRPPHSADIFEKPAHVARNAVHLRVIADHKSVARIAFPFLPYRADVEEMGRRCG